MRLFPPAFLVILGIVIHSQEDIAAPADSTVGVFDGHGDIGHVLSHGSVEYDAVKKSYRISGSGENMWFTSDAFQFVWKKMSGNVSLTADIRWIGTGGNPHRKACLLVRQNLEPNSPYADVAVHGEGLTSLQYRESRGVHQRARFKQTFPDRKEYESKKREIMSSCPLPAKEIHFVQPAVRSNSNWSDPFYIGLGVCAHDSNATEQAVFSNVEITSGKQKSIGEPMLESTLETVTIASTDRRVVYTSRDHFEAPNWSRDGKYFIFNQDGRLYTLPVAGGKPQLLESGFATRCNNDHGISPDGSQLAISDQSKDGKSLIYILPINGGTPRQITAVGPSYWHGWSPDGKTLAFCGERNGEFDIYTIPAAGGEEKRLTNTPGLDDGPDYSPDGQYIYFNSERTGMMQIWRMKTDGSGQEQVTSDQLQQLVCASFTRRQVARVCFVRKRCEGTSGEQGRDAADDADSRRRNPSPRETLRRPRNNQCPIMVPRQQNSCFCELSIG